MKYIRKQRHASTCGAIALANAHKKLGLNMSYDQAIQSFGGMKHFKGDGSRKRGVTVKHFMEVAERSGFEVIKTHMSHNDAKYFSRFDEFAVVLCYAQITKKNKVIGHFVCLDKNGVALNIGNKKDIGKREWRHSRRAWGRTPTVLVLR